MIRIIALIILCVTIWAVGCSRLPDENINNNDQNNNIQNEQPENNDPIVNPDDTQNEPETTTAEGRITEITKNGGELVSFKITDEGTGEYLFNVTSDLNSEIKLGDIVTVTVDGDIAETSPMQATAKEISVNEEFSGAVQTTDIYTVTGISAATIDEKIRNTGHIFESFTNYEECQTYLEENELTDKFNETVGDMDITTLTDGFFEENDLHIFICDERTVANESEKEVYLQDGVLFLRLNTTTTEAALRNSSYELYLIPIKKGTEVKDGYILRETDLSSNISEPSADENLPEDVQGEGSEENAPENNTEDQQETTTDPSEEAGETN